VQGVEQPERSTVLLGSAPRVEEADVLAAPLAGSQDLVARASARAEGNKPQSRARILERDDLPERPGRGLEAGIGGRGDSGDSGAGQ